MLLAVVTLTLCWWPVCGLDSINPYQDTDGRYYYNSSLPCSISGSLYQTVIYSQKTKSYTAIQNNRCCYLADIRSSCCFDSSTKVCRCNPNVTCDLSVTSPPTLTSPTPSSPTAPSPASYPASNWPAMTSSLEPPFWPAPSVAPYTDRLPLPSSSLEPTPTAYQQVTPTASQLVSAQMLTSSSSLHLQVTPTSSLSSSLFSTYSTLLSKIEPTPYPPASSLGPTLSNIAGVLSSTPSPTVGSTFSPVFNTNPVYSYTSISPSSSFITPSSTISAPSSTLLSELNLTTTEPSPTTTGIMPVCPTLQYRVLNGEPVTDDCPYSGAANITFLNHTISTCNAVLVMDTVKGQTQLAFLTSEICLVIIEEGSKAGESFNVEIGNQRYPIIEPIMSLVYGTNGTAFLVIKPDYSNLLQKLGRCQKPACRYNEETMMGKVNFSNCEALSYGISYDYGADGLNKVAVRLDETPGACNDIPDLMNATNTLCFESISGKNISCGADAGGPIYCQTYSTGEKVLVAILSFMTTCDEGSKIKALRLPA